MEKSAVLAPMQKASVSPAVRLKVLSRPSSRKPISRSRRSQSIAPSFGPSILATAEAAKWFPRPIRAFVEIGLRRAIHLAWRVSRPLRRAGVRPVGGGTTGGRCRPAPDL